MSRPVHVEVKPKYRDESIEALVRRFSRKVKKQRIIEKCIERRRYEKPSSKRRKETRRRKKVMEKIHRKHNYFMDE